MTTPVFFYTVIDRDSDAILCDKVEDVLEVKKFLPKPLFEYINKTGKEGRLTATRLVHFNRICIIEKC